jgi:uncharacterized protein YxjI
MFRRGRDDDDDRGRGGRGEPAADGIDRYKMRENLIAFGDDFWIETMSGRRAFFVNGKALRVRSTLSFEDMQGHELAKIQEKMLRIKDTMVIERDGVGDITVKKALFTPLRERFEANMPGGGDIDIQGNITDHSYTMERGGRKVAEVSKKWLAIRDTYTVEVTPGEDDISILAIAVAIDQMTHD